MENIRIVMLAAQLSFTVLAWTPQLGAPVREALLIAAFWLAGANLGVRAYQKLSEGGDMQ